MAWYWWLWNYFVLGAAYACWQFPWGLQIYSKTDRFGYAAGRVIGTGVLFLELAILWPLWIVTDGGAKIRADFVVPPEPETWEKAFKRLGVTPPPRVRLPSSAILQPLEWAGLE